MITAEKIYREILEMPLKEREKLFAVIARRSIKLRTIVPVTNLSHSEIRARL